MSDLAAFVLGALAAVCWLAALLLDFQTTDLPGWAREALHAALVLAVPALIILVAQARSVRRDRFRWWVFLLELLAMVLATLPGLLLVAESQDLLLLPLRIPAFGLGVALGYAVPVRYVLSATRTGAKTPDWSSPTAGGAGFALLLGLAGLVFIIAGVRAGGSSCHGLGCGGLAVMFETTTCGITVFTMLLALGTAALGGVIGRALGRIGG